MASGWKPFAASCSGRNRSSAPSTRGFPTLISIAISQPLAMLTKHSLRAPAIAVRAFVDSSGLAATHQRKA